MNEEYFSQERYNDWLLDRKCSHCGDFADVVIPNKIKLCNSCYKNLEVKR